MALDHTHFLPMDYSAISALYPAIHLLIRHISLLLPPYIGYMLE